MTTPCGMSVPSIYFAFEVKLRHLPVHSMTVDHVDLSANLPIFFKAIRDHFLYVQNSKTDPEQAKDDGHQGVLMNLLVCFFFS